MSKPKWQRARQLCDSEDDTPEDRGNIGGVFWVRGTPEAMTGDCFDGSIAGREPRYHTNIVGPDNRPMVVAARIVELLARDETDFAADVPLISWEQWLKESEAEKTT